MSGVRVCLALDIGGTKLEAGLVTEDAAVLTRLRVQTPPSRDAEVLFGAVSQLVTEMSGRARAGRLRVQVCGVGSGGPMRANCELVSPLNIPAWRDFPLAERLRALEVLAGIGVAVDNDAKALALAEAWVGAGAGVSNFLAMVVSTGIGAGILLDGRLLQGREGNAGHIGHVIVEPRGRRCACGAHGCLEAEASGTAIEASTGRPASTADAATVERSGMLVGRAVASVANLLDLRLALVGGSVALGFGAPFFAAAQRELDLRCRIAHARGTVIAPVGLGDEGPLVGAAAVGWGR